MFMVLTYTVGKETAELVDQLAAEMERRAGFKPKNAQVIRHAVETTLDKYKED